MCTACAFEPSITAAIEAIDTGMPELQVDGGPPVSQVSCAGTAHRIQFTRELEYNLVDDRGQGLAAFWHQAS